MEEKKELIVNEKKKNRVKIFFNSPAGLIVFGGISIFGLVFSILGALDVIIRYKSEIIVIGLLFFVMGMLLVVRYARRAYKMNELAYRENLQLRKEMQQQKISIEILKQKMNSLTDLMQSTESLINLATNGMREILNSITITYNTDKQMYFMELEKHFVITSKTSPIRYTAQFYANKYPTDAEKAKKFYEKEENKISWEDLKVKATIRYKLPGKQNYSSEKELIVKNQLTNGNLIPFDIYFKTKGDNTIEFQQGTEVMLKYCYRIKRELWGTYINRSMGFFKTETIVCLKYDDSFADLKYEVSRLVSQEGNPTEYDEYTVENTTNGSQKEIKLQINTEPFAKYRVSWKAKECFGGDFEDSINGADRLGVTKR